MYGTQPLTYGPLVLISSIELFGSTRKINTSCHLQRVPSALRSILMAQEWHVAALIHAYESHTTLCPVGLVCAR